MTDARPPTPDPLDPAAAEIDDLATFLVLTNRIATRLQATDAVSQSGVALADWLLLYAVRDSSSPSLADVARKVGVSRQRVHQQASGLEAAGLVAISMAQVGKSRHLSLSPRGRELLASINNRLQEALSGGSLATPLLNARRSAARLVKGFAATATKPEDDGHPGGS